jgi:hypothetical protein
LHIYPETEAITAVRLEGIWSSGHHSLAYAVYGGGFATSNDALLRWATRRARKRDSAE